MTTQTEAERLAQWLLDNYEADEIDLAANLLRKQRADIEQLERLLKTSANSERCLQAEIERLNKALAEQPAQQEPVAIHQFRKCGCSDWYDGVPDRHDGQGPYEVRTLYTTPQAQPAREPTIYVDPDAIRILLDPDHSGVVTAQLTRHKPDPLRGPKVGLSITKGNT